MRVVRKYMRWKTTLTIIQARRHTYLEVFQIRHPPRFVAYREVNQSKVVGERGGKGGQDAESSFRQGSIYPIVILHP